VVGSTEATGDAARLDGGDRPDRCVPAPPAAGGHGASLDTTREGDAIAAARRRLPMVEVDPTTTLTGPHGPVSLLDVFEGRQQLIAYYFMWYAGQPAPDQCEGCTWVTTQVGELSYLHARDVTYATFCQGPYEESVRCRDFMDWNMPWYSALDSLDILLADRQVGSMYLVCYLRDRERVFETYWTNGRGVEVMDFSYALLDLTVYGRLEEAPAAVEGELDLAAVAHACPCLGLLAGDLHRHGFVGGHVVAGSGGLDDLATAPGVSANHVISCAHAMIPAWPASPPRLAAAWRVASAERTSRLSYSTQPKSSASQPASTSNSRCWARVSRESNPDNDEGPDRCRCGASDLFG
jgi:predicted dithiol-disulfide oxidoreductase (DUF899 family)